VFVVNMFFHKGNHVLRIFCDKSFVALNLVGVANDTFHGLVHT
jgi:hypothetical protein